MSLGNAQYGILCLQYLTSEPFKKTDHHQISVHARRGYFALHDYAVQCWYVHLLDWAEPPEPEDPSVAQALGRLGGLFMQSYGLVSKAGEAVEEVMTPTELQAAIHALPEDDKERNSCRNIEARTLAIRQCIEMLRDGRVTSEAEEVLDNLYGSWKTYKCSKPWLLRLQPGFNGPSKLSQHKSRYHDTSDEAIMFPALARKKLMTLHAAAEKGSIGMVTAILDTGVNVDTPASRRGRTALYFAAQNGHIEVCKLLISRGASCNTREGVLDVAVGMGDLELVIVLLAGLKTQEDHRVREGTIITAIQYGYEAILKALLQYGDIEAHPKHLDRAIPSGQRGIIEELVKQKDYEVFLHRSLLMTASRHIDFDSSLIKAILSAGQIQIIGDQEVVEALRSGKESDAEVLLRYRNIQLLDDHLKRCRDIAQEKAFGSIVTIIDGMKGLQPGDPRYEAVNMQATEGQE
ncbi:ankyrin repeat-containing domain protein [Lasiosphaeria miniovina]|uniref:Ankyrin repeat-containing domain protein n=1 Tax=Lasiosphaeria miniovina TaxID=1954250 RepID=A0AA40AKW5_9PEZI|nr:ankyrin repeat-containing domain protein [Lasiosphaeria miniovina]KAK0717699.1 ankyrin repeat-containing domain protein [Lasiosphaeria miniovina]